MYKNLLTKKFFQENPYLEFSVQRFVYSIFVNDGLEELADEFITKRIEFSKERQSRIKSEKEQIQTTHDADGLLKLFRKDFEMTSRLDLIRKSLEYEKELLPNMFEWLIRSDNVDFIENAIRFFFKCETNYSTKFFERYDEIRTPYVRSLVCLIIGIRGIEEYIPWMMNQYQEMKKLYPDETYDQGPLMALSELKFRFYRK